MKKLSLPSRLYILATIFAGAAFVAWHLGQLDGASLWSLLGRERAGRAGPGA